jgi:mannose-6-phosphate isomerase class I
MKQAKMGSVTSAKVTKRVGPRLFETEKRILKAYPDSMLAKMFSDNTETSVMVHPDEDGAYVL